MPRRRQRGKKQTLVPRQAVLALRGATCQARASARVQAAPPPRLAGLTSATPRRLLCPCGLGGVAPGPLAPASRPTTSATNRPAPPASGTECGSSRTPRPGWTGPRRAPNLRRLRSVAPSQGPAATMRPGRTRRCESRAGTTVPTGPRGAAGPKAQGGALCAREPGSCSPRVGGQQQPSLAPSSGHRLLGPSPPSAPLEMAEPLAPGSAACWIW